MGSLIFLISLALDCAKGWAPKAFTGPYNNNFLGTTLAELDLPLFYLLAKAPLYLIGLILDLHSEYYFDSAVLLH